MSEATKTVLLRYLDSPIIPHPLFFRHSMGRVMPLHARIAGCLLVLLVSGCQAWHEPPLVPVAEQEMAAAESDWVPPVEPGDIFLPPATLDPQLEPHAVVPLDQGMLAPDPMGLPGYPSGFVDTGIPPYPEGDRLQNPLFVPVSNHDAAWSEIVDVVGNYFKIRREEPVQDMDGLLTEGHIETYAQGGATHIELHRHDSVGLMNRWQSTLQTIQRIANVRIVPTQGGYHIELVVHKELEDLARPEHATAGAATFRSDGSLPSRRVEVVSHSHTAPNWIPLGRDMPLEQQILSEIQARLDVAPQGVVY